MSGCCPDNPKHRMPNHCTKHALLKWGLLGNGHVAMHPWKMNLLEYLYRGKSQRQLYTKKPLPEYLIKGKSRSLFLSKRKLLRSVSITLPKLVTYMTISGKKQLNDHKK